MPTTIADGKGTGSLVKVTGNRLQTETNIREFMSFKAKSEGSAYSVTSDVTSGFAAGAFIHYIKYTASTGGFVITRINVSSDQAFFLKAHKVTGTASGSTITPSNLNFGSSRPANLSCSGNGAVTGISSEYFFADIRIPATQTVIIQTGDIPIIAAGTALGLEMDAIPGSDPTEVAITVFGYESDLET